MNNKIKDAFEKIHADPALVHRTKDHILYKSIKRKHLRWVVATSAFCLVLLTVSSLFYFQPVAALSIDNSSSVEWYINRFGKVVSTQMIDPDNDASLDTTRVKGKDLSEALKTLDPLLSNNSFTTFTLVEDQIDPSSSYAKTLETYLLTKTNCQMVCAQKNDVKSAHSYGLSYGKYQAYLQIKEAGDTSIEPEDLCDLSMQELHQQKQTQKRYQNRRSS